MATHPAETRVERFRLVFGADEDSLDFAFGQAIENLDRAFLRVTNVRSCSDGRDVESAANYDVRDLGVNPEIVDASTGRIERYTTGVDEDFQVDLELWESMADPSSPNAWVVREYRRETLVTVTGTTRSLAGLGIVDTGDVVAILCGLACNQPDTLYARVNTTLVVQGSNPDLVFTRASAFGTVSVTYAVVEFTGSNYTVTRFNVAHLSTGAQVVPIHNVGDWARAIFFTTYRAAPNENGLDEIGVVHYQLTPTDELVIRLNPGADNVFSAQYVSAGAVVSNPDFDVQHRNSYRTSDPIDTADNVKTFALTSVGDMARAGTYATAECAGAGQALPRAMTSYRLSAVDEFEFRRSRDGQPQEYSWWVVVFPDFLGPFVGIAVGGFELPRGTGSGRQTFRGSGLDGFELARGTGSGRQTFRGTGLDRFPLPRGTGSATNTPPPQPFPPGAGLVLSVALVRELQLEALAFRRLVQDATLVSTLERDVTLVRQVTLPVGLDRELELEADFLRT